MQKSYLLLRNNQQSGPYSLEELIGMSLQAKDLIWIIGQSAGWRYPEEIEDLNTGIQGRNSPPASPVPKQGATRLTAEPATVSHQVEHGPERHIYVSLPATTSTASTPAIPPALAADPSTLSFEERVEKMRQRVAAVNTQEAQPEEAEIKYSRSLEDIKAEYSSWMQAQKHKGKVNLRQVGLSTAIVLGAGCFIWGAYYLSSPFPENKLMQKGVAVPLVKEVHLIPEQPGQPLPSTSPQNSQAPSLVLHRAVQNKKTSPETTYQPVGDERISELQTSTASQQVAKVDSSPSSEEHAVSPPENEASIADQLHIDANYIASEKQESGVGGLAVTLKNNSNQILKVVAVDVIYYGEGMKEIDRKTLYFSNLYPGQTLVRNAPAQKKAEGAYAQLGLISSEEGNIFYASNK